MSYCDKEIETDFIREFSCGGNQIGLTVNPDERRERIRVEIFRQGLHDKIYHDSEITYAAMYRLCYGLALEMRKYPKRVDLAAVVMEQQRAERAETIEDEDELFDASDSDSHEDLIE